MASDIKRWVPLECNPEVFNKWAVKAGLVLSQANFQDVLGLDSELLGMVPQPVKAVILVFPDYANLVEIREAEDARIAMQGQDKLDKTIFWVKQTIDNACGTMALIHALANSDVTLRPGSPLADFIDQCIDKTPDERAKTLENFSAIAEIHTQYAQGGQSSVPEDLEVDYHFTCFVVAPEAEVRARAAAAPTSSEPDPGAAAPAGAGDAVTESTDNTSGMRLIELDGTRGGPIDRGECKDLLRDAANYIRTKHLSKTSSVEFSMLALGPPLDE